MKRKSPSQISPADHLLMTFKELEKLCRILQKRGVTKGSNEQLSPEELKLLAEYRQLLKLRFEMLRKARTLIDEACFQRAVLDALNNASEEVYQCAIAKLWELEKEWDGEDEDDPPQEDKGDAIDDEPE